MLRLEVLLVPRHVCLILEQELLTTGPSLQDGPEVTILSPRKWKLLGNEAGESAEQTISV